MELQKYFGGLKGALLFCT